MTVGILADSKLGDKDSLLKIIGENAANLETALRKNGKLTQKILDEIGNEKNAQPELTALLSSKEWSLPKALGVKAKDIKSFAKNGSKFSDLKKIHLPEIDKSFDRQKRKMKSRTLPFYSRQRLFALEWIL